MMMFFDEYFRWRSQLSAAFKSKDGSLHYTRCVRIRREKEEEMNWMRER